MSTIIKNEENESNVQQFQVGDIITVTPTGIKEFGVFCKCPNGFSGLIHISRITPKFVKNVSDYFTIGTSVKAEITGIDHTKQQLSLSTKEQGLVAKNNSSIEENGKGFAPIRESVDNWFKKEENN
ncbi:S1 RNA-binding domain-containing protein [Spiroplasma endosymbiont of Lasioglossum malachurum]|uniref:S1 RNA-binding domain-containing protein n=1 Tax=Spiroplasma endosymbiont of Lasioglossum malachurum TaxID=3066319 RepID=UPI0030CB83E3